MPRGMFARVHSLERRVAPGASSERLPCGIVALDDLAQRVLRRLSPNAYAGDTTTSRRHPGTQRDHDRVAIDGRREHLLEPRPAYDAHVVAQHAQPPRERLERAVGDEARRHPGRYPRALRDPDASIAPTLSISRATCFACLR